MATITQRGQMRRDANNDPLDLLIVGAGFAGMYMLIKARLMGLRALVIEAVPSVGTCITTDTPALVLTSKA
jgi:cation diffusion facilitator CzcD-associated flavoprotein CzcO